MLKTWITLGNISHVLLNQTESLIFVMFKVQTFVPLSYLVSVMIRISNYKDFFTRNLRIVLIVGIFSIAPLNSEFLLGNTQVTMATLQKCPGTFS